MNETYKETDSRLKPMKQSFLIMIIYWKVSFYRIFSFIYKILRFNYC